MKVKKRGSCPPESDTPLAEKNIAVNKNMTKNQKPTIYYKLFLLNKDFYKVVHNMPREHKFSLGSEMLRLTWNCIDLSLEANNLPNSEKSLAIKRLSIEFDKLKLRIRMAEEIKLLSINQLDHYQKNYLTEIGLQIGAWLKWASSLNSLSANFS